MIRLVRVFVVMLAAASIFSLAKAASPWQRSEPIGVDAYWLKVEETQSVVESLALADPTVVRSRLDVQAAGWETVSQVKLSSGAVVPVDSSYLVSLLRADPPNVDGLREYLRALLSEYRRLRASPLDTRPSVDASKALSAVLSRPEFNWETSPPANPIQEWIDKLWQRFAEWLDSVLPSVPIRGSPVLQWIVSLVGMLVLALILVYILRGLVGSVSDETAGQDGDEGAMEIVSAEGAARRAEETARLGDYRSAVRWLYLSSLLVLEERGLLRYDRTRTNREYLRSVAHLPELSAILRDVIDVFDRVWYGLMPVNEEDFTRYAARVADLRRMQ